MKPRLDAGFDTVGTRVDVRHLAATPMGMRVNFRSELIGVEDKRLLFKVEAFDDKEKIGEVTHERAVVDVAKIRWAGPRESCKLLNRWLFSSYPSVASRNLML
jgi:predicted thioesterase